jgi:hypothetical protein
MARGIVSEPLDPRDGFNWVFLVELLICGILTVFFLFYFNRLFATLVSYAIRAYTWHTFRAYIDIQALQISLLGGRIFFKDIRYHGHNETILIHGGYITWKYWLRRVKDADLHATKGGDTPHTTEDNPKRARKKSLDKAEKGGVQPPKQLPCRISIKISGVEAFMYNRSPAYDGIIEAMLRKDTNSNKQEHTQTKDTNLGSVNSNSARSTVNSTLEDKSEKHNQLKKDRVRQRKTATEVTAPEAENFVPKNTKLPEPPSFLRLFPIRIDCNKGAIVVGNENTSAVITAKFEKASGEFNAATCGPLDVYQQVFKFQFTHPVVHMKPNPDFKSSQLEAAARLKHTGGTELQDQGNAEKDNRIKEKGKAWTETLLSHTHIFSRSVDSIHTHPKSRHLKGGNHVADQIRYPGQEEWKGLTRYLDEGENAEHGEWDKVEYAKASLVADCPSVNVSFFWDVAGPVPIDMENSVQIEADFDANINGNPPPEYGMGIQILGGTINYGPWTDRLRVEFQNFFFPGSHVDSVAATKLRPGDIRVLTQFKIFIGLEEDVVLRIPIRESSKDWRWKGKAQTLVGDGKQGAHKAKTKTRGRKKSIRNKHRDGAASAPNVRPFAWIDVKVAGNSSVSYVMDMVASDKGYSSRLDVDVIGTEISSSVNHGLLWRSGAVGLDCDLSTPLGWNSLRKWKFNISCYDLELFLLRDHLFLLIDLVADWGSGPGSDYFTFVPFQYLLDIDFHNFKLYLNTNESNIVNNPSDLDDNNFLILFGKRVQGKVTIPLDRLKPLQNEIKFDVRGHDMGMEMCMPPKNTLNTFLSSNNVAKLGTLTLTGSHTYMTETSAMNTDRLYMDIQGKRLSLELYGFLVHHFMKIKDNYFGENMHFKTLEEFQGLPSQNPTADGTAPIVQPAKITNDLDVILCVSADDVSVLLPANLYSAETSLRVDLPYASADLRFTNYYMDLMVNFSPLSVSLGTSISKQDLPNDFTGQTEVFVDSVVIYGHRLFGLPPTEPTYVCNWDFDIGTLSGECSAEFIDKAISAVRSFAFTFDDDENTFPLTQELIIHDSTFLRLRTADVNLWLHVADEAIMLRTAPITLDFNDQAGQTFSQRLKAIVPDLTIGSVDARSASRHRTRQGEKQFVASHAFLQTTLSFNLLGRKLDFSEERSKQQAHLQEHDQRTNRTPFLFMDQQSLKGDKLSKIQQHIKPPAMQFPGIPQPVFLYQPQSALEQYSISSDYSYRQGSVRKRRRGTASVRSLAQSIRSTQHFQHTMSHKSVPEQSVLPIKAQTYHTLSLDNRRKRNWESSSVALSSSLACPDFPLEQVEPDLSEVPAFPEIPIGLPEPDKNAVIFNDVATKHFDDSFSHTSLLLSVNPGIRIFCTPEAVRCISNLIDLIDPVQPEDLLDALQVDVLTKILDNQKRREGKGESVEFSIRIPFVQARFINTFTHQVKEESVIGKDQYDLILNELKLAARLKSFPGERAGEDTVSLHSTLGSASVSVTEKAAGILQDDVAVYAEMSELLLWLLKSENTSINVSFRGLEFATASKKVEYLASLIHRTSLLGDELVGHFAHVDEKRRTRLQSLAWCLTNSHDQFPDPSFLAKPSYALRAAKDHLRNHDSWKLISRFRFIWQSLADQEKDKLRNWCSHSSTACPRDAEQRVMALWSQWRTWDLAHIKNSLTMRVIYGSIATDVPIPTPGPGALYVEVRSAGMKLIVDPGPKQSEASLRIVAINVAVIPPMPPKGLMLVGDDVLTKSTTIQVSSQDSTVRLNWEICELLENLIRMFDEDKPEKASVSNTALTAQSAHDQGRGSKANTQLHLIYTTESAEVSLDTINLRSVSTGRRLRFSLVGMDQQPSGDGETMTVLVHLEQAVSELFSRSRPMLRSQWDYPSIYFSRSLNHQNGNSDEIQLAGASRKIRVRTTEDLIGFIEVVDTVIRDEAAYFYKVFASQQPARTESTESPKSVTQLPNITVALLMDSYVIDITLIQSLIWSISGSSGRVSVVPAVGKEVSLRVDYDLDCHMHRMYSDASHKSNAIASLGLPPLNGTLKATNTDDRTTIFAFGTVETISLQASDIQALVSILNKPEMSNLVHTIQDDISTLKTRIEEAFPVNVQSLAVERPSSGRNIVFGVQMTFSGLHIMATAPAQTTDSEMGNLVFKLASVQVKATNFSDSGRKILALPEITIRLQQISAEMTLTVRSTVRRCGNVTFGAIFQATAQPHSHPPRRIFRIRSSDIEVNIFAETASAVVEVLNHLQDKIKDLDLSKEKRYLKRLRAKSRASRTKPELESANSTENPSRNAIFSSSYSLELLNIQVSWIVGHSPIPPYPGREPEDLVLSFRRIDLSTRKDNSARLMIEDMQLQMVPESADKTKRSENSALLPEVVFNVAYNSTKESRKLAFQAAGKSLDLRLESRFILPANVLERSIALAGKKFRAASATWKMAATTDGAQRKNPFSNKGLTSLLVDADFAGAVVHLQASGPSSPKESRSQQKGRYSQFVGDGAANNTSLRAPGVALKVEYKDDGHDPSLNAELKINASSNTLFPTVVPLIIDISNSIKEVVRDTDDSPTSAGGSENKPIAKRLEEDNLITADPSALLGRTRLNLGLRICRQEFSLSCQPIARVAAIAKLEDIYVTVNSVKSQEQGHFFAASAAFQKLQATVQHVYSRESTFGFDVDSIVLSMMNSKHLSGTSGISAILKVNPMRLQVNARQLQDFLLFREIWVPPEIRKTPKSPTVNSGIEPQEYLIQRYQQVAAATAFPWNANVSLTDIFVELDLGQAIGKTSLNISNLWASSKKSTTWEQNLCIGVEKVGIESVGRTSGFVELSGVRVRTSISWPAEAMSTRQTPLVQASLGFRQLRVKAGFDYQAFVVADISNFDFLMYNVREQGQGVKDRLVAILDGDKVHVFCTATSAAQGLALYQAVERLVQENQQAYSQSLKDIEKFLRRKSSVTTPFRTPSQSMIAIKTKEDSFRTPISLHTDVVVTLRSMNVGVFPSSFVDSQIFMLEASDTQARFAVALEEGKIHSGLGMTLGQLSVALATVSHTKAAKAIADLTVEDVVAVARSARGGTILRVPKVIATMHTWQLPSSNHIDYIFKSSLEGKVDVGWNYSRISYIRNMWSNHSRSLASRLGKPLPESAVKITTSEQSPQKDSDKPGSSSGASEQQQEKITAVVNVPQSKYEYTPLETPLIETPQLRDMGEATPPLEWIGLHRDRLPNVTHQIVIVSLLEVAKEVEDAYERILGSS